MVNVPNRTFSRRQVRNLLLALPQLYLPPQTETTLLGEIRLLLRA